MTNLKKFLNEYEVEVSAAKIFLMKLGSPSLVRYMERQIRSEEECLFKLERFENGSIKKEG